MNRHACNKALHWTNSILMLAVLASGQAVGWSIAFGLVGLVWAGLALIRGQSGRPGPKLKGWARYAHLWGHRLLYTLTALAALACLGQVAGFELPARQLILSCIAGGALHAVFHLWRHTTLGDNALHMILPKAMHGVL